MIAARYCTLAASALALALVAGCYSESSIKPSEALDERTGMTVGSLQKPIELVEMVQSAPSPSLSTTERRVSFAYLGPVEWDNMGNLIYGLWVHLAPSNDHQFDDIREPGNVRLTLDDGSTPLKILDVTIPGQGPYRRVASWGQAAYFALDVPTLKRMAESGHIELDFKAQGSLVRFSAAPDARETLSRYVHARGY
jgi:hypothetical protein